MSKPESVPAAALGQGMSPSNITFDRTADSQLLAAAGQRARYLYTAHRGMSRPGDRVVYRRSFLATLAVGVLAAPLPVGADERLRRVGWLDLGTAGNTRPQEVLPSQLRELGWVEGKNIAFDWLYADAEPERLSLLVAELLRRNKILRGAKPADLPVEQSSRLRIASADRLRWPLSAGVGPC